MFLIYEEFAGRADAVRARIARACERSGRRADEVELLAVTKTQPPEAADYAARYGLRAVGENRVQEGSGKRALSTAAVAWELIGHLQSNKAGLAVRHFDRVQSVDSAKLLELLDRAASGEGRVFPVLLQINAGADPAKFGADPADAPALLESALAHRNLRVEGLMTIAPLSRDLSVARRAFENLREIRARLAADFATPLRELSMGMSADLEEAVSAGSTQIRVGTALFGDRAQTGA
jgi:pyridoxal phosphate enzyme (YggS family)